MQIEYLSSDELRSQFKHSIVVQGTLVVMPFTQTKAAQQAALLMSNRAEAPGLILAVHDNHQEGFVCLVNEAFKKTDSDYFAYVAQDAFAGRAWLSLAIAALGEKKNLVGLNDGKWAGSIAAFGVARRSWIKTLYAGSFFHASYERHYADVELTLLALQEDVYAYDPEAVLIEVDWQKDISQVDVGDRKLFLERKASGFDQRVIRPELLKMVS
jgi:hypothetical protein